MWPVLSVEELTPSRRLFIQIRCWANCLISGWKFHWKASEKQTCHCFSQLLINDPNLDFFFFSPPPSCNHVLTFPIRWIVPHAFRFFFLPPSLTPILCKPLCMITSSLRFWSINGVCRDSSEGTLNTAAMQIVGLVLKKKMKVQAADVGPHTFVWIKTFRLLKICYSSVIDFVERTIVPADDDVRAEETSENRRNAHQFFSPALAEKLFRFRAEYRRPADPSLENEWLANSSSSFLQTVKVNSHAGSLVTCKETLSLLATRCFVKPAALI